MKHILRKILFGDALISEYKTICVEGHIQETVSLEIGGKIIDISVNHWLLCLDPVVFGIWLTGKEEVHSIEKGAPCKILFHDHTKNKIAGLKLIVTGKIEEEPGTLFLLTLQHCRIYHINFIRTLLIFHRYYKKPQQPFHKLKAFAAAYSYPRKVRVVSFMDGDYFNIFPMDLVGDITQNKRFVFGLRHTNVTLARILESKKLVIAEMPFSQKETIYQLGKHHSSIPLAPSTLPFDLILSREFGFPVPACACSYKEIKVLKTINLGSHMLMWGEPINDVHLKAKEGHLFHIHFLHYLHQKSKGVEYRLV